MSWAIAGWTFRGAVMAVLAASAFAADAPAPALRVIRVRVACDEEFRAAAGAEWKERASARIRTASSVYEPHGVRWEAADVVEWESPDHAKEMTDLLRTLESSVSRDGVDVVIGFTSQKRPDGESDWYEAAGLADYFGPAAIVDDLGDTNSRWYLGVTAHEMGHLLGAWHSTDPVSVMCARGDRKSVYRLDPATAAVVAVTRDLDFAKGVSWLDVARRRALDEAFRSGHAADATLSYADAELAREWSDVADESRGACARFLARTEACVDPKDACLATPLGFLARAWLTQPDRDLDKALAFATRARGVSAGADTSWPPAEPALVLADVRRARGEFREALPLYDEVLQARRRIWPDGAYATAAAEGLAECRRWKCAQDFARGVFPWVEMTWPASTPPAHVVDETFDCPREGALHLRPTATSGDERGRPLDAVSAAYEIAAPVAGVLAVELRDVRVYGGSPILHRVEARLPASAPGAKCATLEFLCAPKASTGPHDRVPSYAITLSLRPPGDAAAESSLRFELPAPLVPGVRLAHDAPLGAAGFLSLPFATTLLRERLWVATSVEKPSLEVCGDDLCFVDEVSVRPDGAGAKRTWRLELTFVPDQPK